MSKIKLEEFKLNQENWDKIDKSLKSVASYMEEGEKSCKEVDYVSAERHWESIRCLHDCLDSVRREIYNESRYLQEYLGRHTLLPKLSPSQLENLLKAAGAENDFEVMRQYAVASEQKGNKLEIDIV